MAHRKLFSFTFASILSTFLLTAASPAWAERPFRADNGKLRVLVSTDIQGKECRMQYGLEKGGKIYKIRFRGRAPEGLFTGQRVRVKGTQLTATNITVSASTGFEVLSGELPAALSGQRSVLVLKIKSSSAVSSATEASWRRS